MNVCWKRPTICSPIIKPGMEMAEVDATIRCYNAERLVQAE